MARGNEQVQQRLFDRLDMLLNIQGAEAKMAECLTEVLQLHSLTMPDCMGVVLTVPGCMGVALTVPDCMGVILTAACL